MSQQVTLGHGVGLNIDFFVGQLTSFALHLFTCKGEFSVGPSITWEISKQIIFSGILNSCELEKNHLIIFLYNLNE